MTPHIRLASAQYPLGTFGHWDDFGAKLTRWVREAAFGGAQLLMLPEYASLELLSLCPPEVQRDERRQFAALQAYLPAYLDLHGGLARTHGVYLLAGSFPEEVAGRVVNRAYFFGPDGARDFQDKLVLTRFEDEDEGMAPGDALKVFDTALGRLAVNVCYDSEFPQLARAQAEAGAELLLVPSYTKTAWGYHRVRAGSLARALENQIYVAQSPLVGNAPQLAGAEFGSGAAGVYAPPDVGLPADGVVAQGELGAPCWLHTTLDLHLTRESRHDGHILNAAKWPRAVAQTAGGAVAVKL